MSDRSANAPAGESHARGDRDAHSGPDSGSDGHVDVDANWDERAYGHAHSGPDSGSDSHVDANSDGGGDGHGYGHTNAAADGVAAASYVQPCAHGDMPGRPDRGAGYRAYLCFARRYVLLHGSRLQWWRRGY